MNNALTDWENIRDKNDFKIEFIELTIQRFVLKSIILKVSMHFFRSINI